MEFLGMINMNASQSTLQNSKNSFNTHSNQTFDKIPMNFVWFQSIHTSFECATRLRSHHICTIPNQFICNYFFCIQFFPTLWIWKESNHGCFMPIQIHNHKTHILRQQYVATKFNEFFPTIKIFPTNYWSKNWNMQPINCSYNLRNSMKYFKLFAKALNWLSFENWTNKCYKWIHTNLQNSHNDWYWKFTHPYIFQCYITYF